MTASDRLSPATVGALMLVLTAVMVPHLMRLGPALGSAVALLILWRAATLWGGWPLPRLWIRRTLTLGLVSAVGLAHGTLLGLNAGLALLCAMGALKLIELRKSRDGTTLVFLGYFLILAQLLFNQSPASGAYLFAGVWALTTLLVAIHRETGRDRPWEQAGLAGSLLLQALPVAAVLFVLFPRIDGPLLGRPEGGSAKTGLDDRLAPGAISRLSRSGEVAFRVTFENGPPPPSQRYWRGPVLGEFDGRAWEAEERPKEPPPQPRNAGRQVSYRVMLEPHYRRWLFGLDIPAQAPPGVRLDRDLTLMAEDPVRQLRQYTLRSFPEYRLRPGDSPGERYLALPQGGHPRARRLARSWAEGAEGPRGVVDRALRFFRGGEFRYTLTPPASGTDWIDAFLFRSRAGFCGHFAGSFAFLMRAAGVPARVVTGYLGGEMAPTGDYMIVRQSDAHAWTEVWLPSHGWARVDPTTAVSPARLEGGLAESVPSGAPVPEVARSGGGWLKSLRLQLDALETAWNRWILAYGADRQRQLLGRFGLGEWPRMVGALAAGLAGTGGLLAGWVLLRRSRTRRDPSARIYARFERKLARAGLRRLPGEGPRDFGERAIARFPGQAAAIREITDAYTGLRYGVGEVPVSLRELRRRVARLRIPGRRYGLRGGKD